MGVKILIIEDNETNLELMSYLLQQYGYETAAALDGEKGLQLAFELKPDLIICDIQLPKLDGYEIVRQLKQSPEHRTIPTIAVTALAMVGDKDKILSAGYDGYIDKPIEPQTFAMEVAAFLSPSQQSQIKLMGMSEHLGDSNKHLSTQLKGKILVVDDSTTNIELMNTLLSSVGLTISIAHDPMMALQLLATDFQPDLFIIDYHLPYMSGAQLINKIKKDQRFTNTPTILISSSYLNQSEKKEVDEFQIQNVILRPIEPAKFLEMIIKIMQ